MLELADELAAITTEQEDCLFDGYEFGQAEATIFAYAADTDKLFAVLEPALRRSPVSRGAVVTKRYGRADDATAREVKVHL